VAEFIACARYGDLEALIALVNAHLGSSPATPAALHPLYISRGTGGNTALHMAAANGELPIITHLLSSLSPSDVNARNDDGSTPLHWAALNGKLDVVEALLTAGADATIKNESGRSPSTVAEQQGHHDVVNRLLKSFDPEEGED
ncbi:ankyrin repeat-containing domain protein, partial [Blyttiomyces helicus]